MPSYTAAQPFTRSSTHGVADELDDLAKTLGLLGVLARHLGQAFTEDLPGANGIATTPTSDPQADSDGASLQGQILQMTPVVAVPR